MPDVISDTNGKLCVGSYHMWRLLSNPDNYSFYAVGSSYCFLAVPFAPDTVDISGLCGGGKQPVTDNTLYEIR